MKSIENLTDAELLALTDEAIAGHIRLRKAEEGIRILPEPICPTLKEINGPDIQVFEIAGYAFHEREKAEEIAAVINKYVPQSTSIDYDYYRGDGKYRYTKANNTNLVHVAVENVYSPAKYAEIRDAVESNKRVKDSFDKTKDEYDTETEKAADIVTAIYDRIQGARDRANELENHKLNIANYLELAQGDVEVAWNFFKKAYVITPEMENLVRSSDAYQAEVAKYA